VVVTAGPSSASITLTVLLWAGSGLTIAVMLWRRGHDLGPFVVLGLAFGPLLSGLAVDHLRNRDPRHVPQVVASGSPPAPGRRVLIGTTPDSPSVATALRHATDWVDGPIGVIRVATVMSFEVAEATDPGPRSEVAERLRAAVAVGPVPGAQVVVLTGHPLGSLRQHAEAGGFDVIVLSAGYPGDSNRPLTAPDPLVFEVPTAT